jgi:hypothetical protein
MGKDVPIRPAMPHFVDVTMKRLFQKIFSYDMLIPPKALIGYLIASTS